VRICFTVNDEECVLELPAEVDPVTMVGEDLEGLPAVEEHVAEPENASQARKKSSQVLTSHLLSNSLLS
jgi:hypothetical protein